MRYFFQPLELGLKSLVLACGLTYQTVNLLVPSTPRAHLVHHGTRKRVDAVKHRAVESVEVLKRLHVGASLRAQCGALRGIEIEANTWHTLLAEQPGTVLMEVKQGPYAPVSFSNFAPWSPHEGAADVRKFMTWCRRAQPGMRFQ